MKTVFVVLGWAGGPHTANDYQVRNGIAVIGVYDCPADADDCAEAAREDDPNRVVWVKTAENFPKTP